MTGISCHVLSVAYSLQSLALVLVMLLNVP